jgi:hypothetical protein
LYSSKRRNNIVRGNKIKQETAEYGWKQQNRFKNFGNQDIWAGYSTFILDTGEFDQMQRNIAESSGRLKREKETSSGRLKKR